MKEASYYKKLKNGNVQCFLCPKKCVIEKDSYGFCNARKNIDGKLYSAVYSNPCAVHIDPIEKKPLYHFMPGEKALSIGTIGCNLECKHCQNWTMSRAKPEGIVTQKISPEEIIEIAVEKGCGIISYTYNEPTVFFEYMLDCAKIAKKKGLKNTIVSNGFINEEPLKELCKYIDGANVDLKSFNNKFYKDICSAWLEPVLESLKILKQKNVWLEITNLIIPTLNDNIKEIGKMCIWIKENLGADVPLHFTGFYPCYKLLDIPKTSPEILKKARKIALKTGIKHSYVGNVFAAEENNTYCPKCGKLLIERSVFSIIKNNIKNSKCSCGEQIAGVFE
ncbi:AmmeMemoRadiSam system radical SAM enzyme [Candidatus Woesearchaeota archaeon CG_4_10_14_0_2_um_filter_33_10]|nr:MAG: AmmeMemoRadiSam system radical SAM enzyme [Candidatus Woesearchaeota archaeon CG_4_10_14_0_2_um_filter_33_10]